MTVPVAVASASSAYDEASTGQVGLFLDLSKKRKRISLSQVPVFAQFYWQTMEGP